jgi:DNA polymerase-4
MTPFRKIIHIDMDAFYAAVEQRDEPAYRGKPIAVGGTPAQRGAVATASYEARQYGIHSAMPSRTAAQKCPHLIFVKPCFAVYRAISQQIRDIFHRYTDWVEPLALDEAYLDVTENHYGLPSATQIAQEIRQLIYQETGLTASAGVSINKFLAKIASGLNKPNGFCLIAPQAAEAFVEQLPIEKFYGVGQVTAAKMHRLGIYNGADLKRWPVADLMREFGKVGQYYYNLAHVQDDRPVQPNRVRKSLGVENSFEPELVDRALMVTELEAIAQSLYQQAEKQQFYGRTLTLKVKFVDYQQVTRSRTLMEPIHCLEQVSDLAEELLALTEAGDQSVRLLGLALSNLSQPKEERVLQYQQLSLWQRVATDGNG